MSSEPRETTRQKSSANLPQEAYIALARTQALLNDRLDKVLGPRELSLPQYNVLRILRGAGKGGLCRNEIASRIITRMPDVTRLLDRMEAAGLVSRVRSTVDRRLVNTTLTKAGRNLVDDLDTEINRAHKAQLGHLKEAELRMLIDLMEKARAAP